MDFKLSQIDSNGVSLKKLFSLIETGVNWSYSLDLEKKTKKHDERIFFEYPSGNPVWIQKCKGDSFIVVSKTKSSTLIKKLKSLLG
jgi:hypothetical protein